MQGLQAYVSAGRSAGSWCPGAAVASGRSPAYSQTAFSSVPVPLQVRLLGASLSCHHPQAAAHLTWPVPALLPSLQVQLLGATLSIGRPSGYVDPGKAAAAATVAAEALARFQVASLLLPCSCPLLFLGLLPPLFLVGKRGWLVWVSGVLLLGPCSTLCCAACVP